MSIKTAMMNGVATIEIARPEKKNAITPRCTRRWPTRCARRRTTAAVRAVLITGQPGIFTSGNDLEDFMQRPPRRRRLAGVPVHAGADRHRQAGRRRGDRRGDRHRHDDAAALRLRLCVRRSAPRDAVRQPRPGARVRVEPGRSAADRAVRGRREAAARRTVHGARAVDLGIANAVLPAGEVVNHARRIAERFNALPPGAVRETKKLMRRARRRPGAQTIGVEGQVFAARLQSPEAKEAFSAFFQKRKPDFSTVLLSVASR